MTKIDPKICSKAKDPTNCYKCMARLEQLLAVEDLSQEDREQVQMLVKAFSDQGRTPTEEDVALITKLSNLYLI